MSKRRQSLVAFWFESFLSAAAGFLCVLTMVRPTWIELVVHVDPDGHDGSLEWLVSGAFLAASLMLAAVARRRWRRLDRGLLW